MSYSIDNTNFGHRVHAAIVVGMSSPLNSPVHLKNAHVDQWMSGQYFGAHNILLGRTDIYEKNMLGI